MTYRAEARGQRAQLGCVVYKGEESRVLGNASVLQSFVIAPSLLPLILFPQKVKMQFLGPVGQFVLSAISSTTSNAVSAPAPPGCGISYTAGFSGPENNLFVVSDGRRRRYGVWVPDNYNASVQHPLIVDFHGRNGSPYGQYNNSQYYLSTEGQRYVVVYPLGCAGRGGETAWQGAKYANCACNDELFISELVPYINQTYCINSSQIYASGKSNGGGFVDTLACSDTGDLFAAFAMAGAAMYTDNQLDGCNYTRAIMEAHGTLDPTININGNVSANGGPVPNITEWTGWWAQRDGCAASTAPTISNETWGNLTTYSCDDETDVVKQYRVDNGGHCWPTTGANTDSHLSHCGVDKLNYTAEVLAFFAKWSLGDLRK